MDSIELGKAAWALRVMQAKIRPRFGWLEASFLGLVLLALGIRLWELDGRVMHYDEAIHIYYAWRLSNLEEYIHAPWMHGPFQIEFTALIFRLFGDTDFTARLGYVLFGTTLVGLPYFLHDHLGRFGALLAGVMLAVSPTPTLLQPLRTRGHYYGFLDHRPAGVGLALYPRREGPLSVPGFGSVSFHVRYQRDCLLYGAHLWRIDVPPGSA